MDNPAVSAPAVLRLQPSQQITGTETKTKDQTSSPVPEPSTVGTQTPSKNDEGWRRVVRNFSPSCESPVTLLCVAHVDHHPMVEPY